MSCRLNGIIFILYIAISQYMVNNHNCHYISLLLLCSCFVLVRRVRTLFLFFLVCWLAIFLFLLSFEEKDKQQAAKLEKIFLMYTNKGIISPN